MSGGLKRPGRKLVCSVTPSSAGRLNDVERGFAAAAVAKRAFEVCPSGIPKNSAPTGSVCAWSPGEAGFYRSRAGGMVSAPIQKS